MAKVVLDLAIFDRSVAVCGELGVPDQLRKLVLKEYRSPADRYSKLRGQFEQACQSFKKAERAVREGVGGKRQGGQGVKSREGKLRAAAIAQQGRAEDLLGQMRGAWEEAKKRRLLKAPLPKMPPSTLPPFGKWEVIGGHQEELLHGVVFAGHPGGWEVYDLAATAVSRSCTQKLRDRGVSVRMHTAPDSCNRHNCMYVAVKIILWHMSHPVGVWDTPPRPEPCCHVGAPVPGVAGQNPGMGSGERELEVPPHWLGPCGPEGDERSLRAAGPSWGVQRACPLCPPLRQHGTHCGTFLHREP